MCCGLVAVDAMCTTEALGILKLSSPSSGIVVTCNRITIREKLFDLIEFTLWCAQLVLLSTKIVYCTYNFFKLIF